MADIRLNKIIRQFNIGLKTLVDYLGSIGVIVDYNPNAKISDQYLPILQRKFGIEEKSNKGEIDDRERFLSVSDEDRYNVQTTGSPSRHLNHMIAPEDFDWEAFEGGSEVYGKSDSEEIEDAYHQILSKIVEHEVVEGTVTAISKREVIVSIGYEREGVIQAPEFRYNPDLKVGDKVEVYVESAEDRKGLLILSHKKARALKAWTRVNEAFNNDESVKGFIKTRTKGGMIVDVFGIEAFLPGSQIDIKPIRDFDAYVNQTMDFKIIKINEEFRNVVISRRILLEKDYSYRKGENTPPASQAKDYDASVFNDKALSFFKDKGLLHYKK